MLNWAQFLTPARVFTGLAAMTGGSAIAVTAAGGKPWVAILLGAVNLFCTAILAFSGPVQVNAEEARIAAQAIETRRNSGSNPSVSPTDATKGTP